MTTKYHAKYFAHHITKKGGTGLEKLRPFANGLSVFTIGIGGILP
ncbi:MAG: hypothetical protein ABEK17_03430 [Candidatus Aenigmatarchaeota archaeon]